MSCAGRPGLYHSKGLWPSREPPDGDLQLVLELVSDARGLAGCLVVNCLRVHVQGGRGDGDQARAAVRLSTARRCSGAADCMLRALMWPHSCTHSMPARQQQGQQRVLVVALPANLPCTQAWELRRALLSAERMEETVADTFCRASDARSCVLETCADTCAAQAARFGGWLTR